MKRFLKFLCMCLVMNMADPVAEAAMPTKSDLVIVSSTDNKPVTAGQMTKKLAGYDVVFFGEFHDQDVLHALEYDVLKQLYAIYGDKLVLSLEMFEADTQPVLNKYLAGEVSEADFLADSRPWPRYQADYRPMVEFAKIHKLPVLASNVPRFLAAKMAKAGTLENIEAEYRPYLPAKTSAPEGKYKEKFTAYMSKGQGKMQLPPHMVDQVFAAQCLKDDKMAESIFYYLQNNKDKVVYHVNGCFHSDGHLGTVERLEALDPSLKVGVITSKDMPADKNYRKNHDDAKKDGEYVVYFPRVEKQEEK